MPSHLADSRTRQLTANQQRAISDYSSEELDLYVKATVRAANHLAYGLNTILAKPRLEMVHSKGISLGNEGHVNLRIISSRAGKSIKSDRPRNKSRARIPAISILQFY
jgi:hypothetical protein